MLLAALAAGVAALLLATTMGTPGSSTRWPLVAGVGVASALLCLVVVRWWVGVLVAPAGYDGDRTSTAGVPRRDPRELASRESLAAALSIEQGSEAARVRRRARLINIADLVWLTVFVFAGLALGWQIALEQPVSSEVAAALAISAAVGVLFATQQLRSANASDAPYLRRLGLVQGGVVAPTCVSLAANVGDAGVLNSPTATVLAGRRSGIEFAITIQPERMVTVAAVRAATWAIHAEGGRLVADGQAPPAVRAAISDLRGDRRWRTVHIRAYPSGIVATRERWNWSRDPWLADIWLVEYLIGRLADGTS